METTTVSFSRELDKEHVVQIHNGIPLSHKKRWNTAIYNNMDGPWEYYAKWNKAEKAKNYHDFTHMWDIKLKLSDTGSNVVGARGKG